MPSLWVRLILSFKQRPYTIPVFVLSNTLQNVPDNFKDKAEIISGEIKSIIESLNEKGFNNLYIDGGKTIQSFMKQNLIDEIIITRVPIILGSGIPLFTDMNLEIKFKHLNTELFNNNLVQSRYIKK